MGEMHPDTVAIHQLRLRQVAGDGAARRGIAALRREVEYADWPRPAGESWVFIRRLETRAAAGRLAGQLAREARRQMLEGGGDNVVRFANLAELLAALFLDLVRGQAASRWYWRRWAHLFPLAPARAAAELLAEPIVHLPAVSAALARQGMLESVWLALDEPAALQLVREFARRGGYRVPEAAAVEAERAAWPREGDSGPDLRIPGALQIRWGPVLGILPRGDARRRLALLLIAQETAPLMLQRAPASLLARLERRWEQPFAPPGASPPALARAREQGEAPPPRQAFSDVAGSVPPDAPGIPPPEDAEPRASGNAAAEPEATVVGPDRPLSPNRNNPPDRADHRPWAAAAPGDAPGGGSAGLPALPHGQGRPDTGIPGSHPLSRLRVLPARPEAPDPACDRFHTRQGGLLYLLNFLNRAEPQALMGEFWRILPNGWAWLYRLGRELGLDEDDPIAFFLARQLGFDHAAELEQLPPLPARTGLLDLAQGWYGRAGLWQPELLSLEADVHYTPSHVDLYAPMTAVRLPVRLAGLDIDPGWLPWLGKVVKFHYG